MTRKKETQTHVKAYQIIQTWETKDKEGDKIQSHTSIGPSSGRLSFRLRAL